MSEAYRNRMLAVAQELRAQGVWMSTSAPPIYRLAWRAGVRVRPPLYQPFRANAITMGAGFAFAYGLLQWLNPWRQNTSVTATVFVAVFAGLIFGLGMAATFRRKASRLQLPPLNPPADNR